MSIDRRNSSPCFSNALPACSICLVALDPTTGKAIQTNETFTQRLGPLYKFQEYAFWDAATTTGESRDTLRKAIQQVMMSMTSEDHDDNNMKDHTVDEEEDATNNTNHSSSSSSSRQNVDSLCVHAVEMLTLCGDAGMPMKRHFDWTIGTTTTTQQGGTNPDDKAMILLFGTATSAAATILSSNEQEDAPNKINKSTFKDSEFVDFFQNAPIALHWLSEAGIVLWANQTELDVLGYTAEEYIGQPIMNFCPDEQELVLEVFKQLGSGNAIRDVPVRFRTKDGRIVNLLVDSNVKYDTVKTETGETTKKFGHTRCFIRDDTSRQIREARAKTLLQETKRSLKMLDNFSSRSIHHMRTPLQIMQNTCELVTEQLVLLQQHPDDAGGGGNNNKKIETDECIALLQNAEAQITKAVHLSDDLVQLGRLDQGAELVLSKTVIDLVTWGQEVLYASFATCDAPATTKDRPLSLEITPAIFEDDDRDCDGGPAKIYSDRFVLNRVLTALLEHARRVHDYKQRDMVTLRIGYQSGGLCTVEVIFKVDTKTSDDDGYSSSCSTASSNHKFSAGKFPPIFQRYHQEYIPEETMEVDFETATSLRQGIERHVNSFQDNNLGISLSLAYFLVQGLNSELRYALQPNGMTKFFFVLPKHDLPEGVECSKLLPEMIVVPSKESNMTTQEKSLDAVPALNDSLQNLSDKATTFPTFARSSPTKGTTGPSLMAPLDYVSMKPLTQEPSAPRKRRASVFNVAQHEMMSPIKLKREVPIEVDVPKFQIACQGFTPMDPPHVLIVEDTEMAAKMLRVTLSKFNCTSDTVVNGRLAVDKLRNAAPGEYDLVLMDLRMPEMDGLTATKILKQEMKLSVPIIALTAETRASIRAECEEIGFDDFYSKPLTRDGLKDVLLKHTGYKVI